SARGARQARVDRHRRRGRRAWHHQLHRAGQPRSLRDRPDRRGGKQPRHQLETPESRRARAAESVTVARRILGIDRANFWPAVAAAGVLLLLLAGGGIVMYNEQSYKDAKTQQAEAQSRILASTVTAALAFDDRKAAHEYVKALGVDPQIQVAAVYDAQGDVFAA